MTNKTRKTIKLYLKNISKQLNCSLSFKNVFLQATKEKIFELAARKETLTMNDLYTEFGPPEEVVMDLFDKEEYSKLLAKSRKRTLIVSIVAIIFFISLLVSSVFIIDLIDTYSGTTTVTDFITDI